MSGVSGVYLPLYIFYGRHLLAAKLRWSNILAGEAGIATQQDARLRPTTADVAPTRC